VRGLCIFSAKPTGLSEMLVKTVKMCPLFCVVLGPVAEGQTNCALQHPSTGVYICYPNPAENPADAVIPESFHLSAQGNAPKGQTISRFRVLLDDHLVYENRLVSPGQTLSIETNLKSPFNSGVHVLQFVVDGVGTTEVKGIQIVPAANASFCDPFFRADRRTCNLSRSAPLQWSLNEPAHSRASLSDEYLSLLDLYGHNINALEADVSDAVAIDANGDVYVASHVFSNVEIRKYAPDGSIIYDSLIRSCGDGFLSVAGLAIDNTGRAWIAANTTACSPATPGAFQKDNGDGRRTRGFVILVDTTKPSSVAPVYVTYLSDVDYQITGIRVDGQGDAYLAGATGSAEYPHESFLQVTEGSDISRSAVLGFVSVLNSSGSGLLWSTLLPNTELNALALEDTGNVYVTGGVLSGSRSLAARNEKGAGGATTETCDSRRQTAGACDQLLVAKIIDRGRELSYAVQFGGSGDQEGRAISASPRGDFVFVTGETDSPDFLVSKTANVSHGEGQRSMVIAMQPCKTGFFDVRFIPDSAAGAPIAFGPALDAFASVFPQQFSQLQPARAAQMPPASIQIAPPCSTNKSSR
jgi:hypothetical protein